MFESDQSKSDFIASVARYDAAMDLIKRLSKDQAEATYNKNLYLEYFDKHVSRIVSGMKEFENQTN